MAIKYITKFNTETEYNDFLESSDCGYVNVSYIESLDENRYYKENDVQRNLPFAVTLVQYPNGIWYTRWNDTPNRFLADQAMNGHQPANEVQWPTENTDCVVHVITIESGERVDTEIPSSEFTQDNDWNGEGWYSDTLVNGYKLYSTGNEDGGWPNFYIYDVDNYNDFDCIYIEVPDYDVPPLEFTFDYKGVDIENSVTETCKLKLNDGPWQYVQYTLDQNDRGLQSGIYMQEGDTIQIMRKGDTIGNFFDISGVGKTSSLRYNFSGNIMSTICGEDFAYSTPEHTPYPLKGAWPNAGDKTLNWQVRFNSDLPYLEDISNLYLPTRGYNEATYFWMFKQWEGNSKLRHIAPFNFKGNVVLDGMYEGCPKLRTVATMNITTLYSPKDPVPGEGDIHAGLSNLFKGCSLLGIEEDGTISSQMDWTSIKKLKGYRPVRLFAWMFQDCANIRYAPDIDFEHMTFEFSATPENNWNDAADLFNSTFYNCPNLISCDWKIPVTFGQFKLIYETVFPSMFEGCTNLTKAFTLVGEPITDNMIFQRTFNGCTNLRELCLPALAGTIEFREADNISPYGTIYVDNGSIYFDHLQTDYYGHSPLSGWRVESYTGYPDHDYSEDYLTFTAVEDTTFSFSENDLQYSLDDGQTWTTLTAGTNTPTVTAGNKILWKQTGLTPVAIGAVGIGTFSSSARFNVSGNIMSLYYGDNFANQLSLAGKTAAFAHLFYQCSGLKNAHNLVLPATTLADHCYLYMFGECSGLTSAPAVLPATTLTFSCYGHMFDNCINLINGPEIPDATPEESCYDAMFRRCRNLHYIKCMATDLSAANCTMNWTQGVSESFGTFVKSPYASWSWGSDGIPNNWSEVNVDL